MGTVKSREHLLIYLSSIKQRGAEAVFPKISVLGALLLLVYDKDLSQNAALNRYKRFWYSYCQDNYLKTFKTTFELTSLIFNEGKNYSFNN